MSMDHLYSYDNLVGKPSSRRKTRRSATLSATILA
jgi:hypothetical protein